MNDHKQILTLMIAIMGLTASFFAVIFTEINQVEQVVQNHQLLPSHAVAGEKLDNIEKAIKALDEKLDRWYFDGT